MIFSIGMRHRTVRPVEFVCPRCGLDRTGTELVPGRWARVAGVPVLPMGEHDAVVICDDCGHESDLGVLDVPTTEQLVVLLEHATVAALVIAIRSSDAARVDEATASAADALRDVGFDPDGVGFDAALDTMQIDEARRRIRSLSRELTTHGKQGFLHRVTAVAMAGQPLDPSARDALITIGGELGMAAPHISGVLAVAATHAEV